jgi:hypothetical protein
MTNTLCGIRPPDVPAFVAGQSMGCVIALLIVRVPWPHALYPVKRASSLDSVSDHG